MICYRWCRCANRPATFCQPFRLEKAGLGSWFWLRGSSLGGRSCLAVRRGNVFASRMSCPTFAFITCAVKAPEDSSLPEILWARRPIIGKRRSSPEEASARLIASKYGWSWQFVSLRSPHPGPLPRERGSVLALTWRLGDHWLRLRLWSFPMAERNIEGIHCEAASSAERLSGKDERGLAQSKTLRAY